MSPNNNIELPSRCLLYTNKIAFFPYYHHILIVISQFDSSQSLLFLFLMGAEEALPQSL